MFPRSWRDAICLICMHDNLTTFLLSLQVFSSSGVDSYLSLTPGKSFKITNETKTETAIVPCIAMPENL